jgi:beta-glucuronidase
MDPYTFPIKDYHKTVLHDLIQRDKNHPSVIMWSMGNEPDTENFPESAYEYWRELYAFTHKEDPADRPVTFVCCQNDYTRDLVTRTMDVVCINRYYGWYNLSGDLDSAVYAWEQELDFWAAQGKPVMVTEYGCDTLPGFHGSVAEMWTEEFQKEYYRRIDEVFDTRSFFIGEHLWAFADFNTIQGVYRADGNRKGLFTRERRPKLAAHWLKDRWHTIPNFGYKSDGQNNTVQK